MRFSTQIAWLLLWTVCGAQDCQEPPPSIETEILIGTWSDQTYAEDTKATYKCRPGYRTLGAIVRVCKGGQWNSLNPTRVCQKKPCGHPGDTPFGSFHLEKGETFHYGAKAVYTCDDGYQLLGQINYRECDADGWTNDIPICEVIKCEPVTEPENGKVVGVLDLDREFSYGQVVRFECDPGFMLDGPKEIHCSTNGDWSEPTPRCVEISCEVPKVPNGKLLSQKKTYKENERFQYTCNRGYHFGERGDAVCTKSGWSPSPSCKEVTCTRPNIANGVYRPEKNIYKGEDLVTYECKNNFYPAERSTTIECTITGWVPYPRCVLKPCDVPKIRHGGLYDESRRYAQYYQIHIGKELTYYCDHGYVSPSKTHWGYIRCTQTGWEPAAPCRRKCVFDYLENGKYGWRAKTYYQGESFIPECHSGFSLPNGESVMTCTENGWSPPPRCVRVQTCSRSDIEIKHGFLSETAYNYPVNKRAQYKCSPGYVTASGETTGFVTCLRDGWSVQPTCIKSCDRPVLENAVTKRNDARFKIHDQLEYECKPGYENREGRTTGSIVCEQDGWSDRPACFERECEVPRLGPFVMATPRKEKYKVGEVLKFSCKNKRERVGPDSIQCYHFGWSPHNPVCKEHVQNCGPPDQLSNGRLTEMERETYKHGAIVEYVCDPRFLMKGAHKIQCVDGSWTSLPSCIAEERTCKDKPELDHGFAEPSAPPYNHGDSLTFNCTDGFTMVGQRSITCIQGVWTHLPKCIATHELQKCTKHKLFSSNPSLNDKREFNHNENVTYICEKSKLEKSTTCINGQWDPEINCNDKSKIICPPPPQIPNAQLMKTTVNYQDGDKISILCQENYLLQESEEIECKNGIWQSIPQCVEKVPCSEPPQIEHQSTISASSSLKPRIYPHGTTLNYTCQDGFRIADEDNRITCSMGKWSSPPQCVGIPCKPPPGIPNGIIERYKSDGYQHGEEVMYTCNEDYGIDGPATAKCLRGNWSSLPECIKTACLNAPTFDNAILVGPKKDSYKSGQHVTFKCSDYYQLDGSSSAQCINSKWIGGPTCRDVSCGQPPTVENAEILNRKGRYPSGERVRYECHKPLELYGDVEVRCLNGTWTKPPQCKESTGKCGPPPPIDNGDIISYQSQEYAPESTVDYQCQSYYRLKGDKTIICRNGRWSDPPTCIIPCTISEDIMNKQKIRLKWLDKKKLYSPSGDTVEFVCQSGYYEVSPRDSFRTTCENGELKYPTCRKNTYSTG